MSTQPLLFALSQDSPQALARLTRAHQEQLNNPHMSLTDLVIASSRIHTAGRHRLAVVGQSHQEFGEALASRAPDSSRLAEAYPNRWDESCESHPNNWASRSPSNRSDWTR